MRKPVSYSRHLTYNPAWRRYAASTTWCPGQYTYGKKSSWLLAGGHSSLDGPDTSKQVKRHKEEAASPKRIIGEYAVANDALKKALGGELK